MRLTPTPAGVFTATLAAALRSSFVVLLGLAATGLGGCTTEPLPGRCQKSSECQMGQTCVLTVGSPDYKRCVSAERADGGDSGGRPPIEGGDGPTTDGGGGDGDPIATPDGGTEAAPPDPAICPPGKCSAPEAPYCSPAGDCVECVDNTNCQMPGKGFCVEYQCKGCVEAGAMACQGETPVCLTSGECVACTDAALHCKEPGKGFCVANACVGCQDAPMGSCQAPTAVCNMDTGICVQCVAHAECPMPNQPVCVGNTCQSCAMEPGSCATIDAAKPVCNMASGACVECTTSADCSRDAKKPICDTATNTCVPCTEDAQCAAKGGGPGVCLAHIDAGRCATDEETVYVENRTGCGSAGTKEMPACSTGEAANLVRANRNLVVVRGRAGGATWSVSNGVNRIEIVGQQNAIIEGGGPTGIDLRTRGDFLIRDVSVQGYTRPGVGLLAQSGTILRLRRVRVQQNTGGGIHVNGARFDIRDTLVAKNGPGQTGPLNTLWGGILVQPVPSGAPKRLEKVTLRNNSPSGLACESAIEAEGIRAAPDADSTEPITEGCGNITSCEGSPAQGCGSTLDP